MNREQERIKWRCRRGMLEIDLFLVPYCEHCFSSLSQSEQNDFVQLLEEQDPDLHLYLMAKKQHDQPAIQTIIDKIRVYRFTLSQNQFL